MSQIGTGLLKDFADVDAADTRDLVGRLDVMHALDFFKDYKRETFVLMGADAGRRLADIGCGTGEDAMALAELVGASGHVTGFDASTAMIDEARLRHGGRAANLDFVKASAEALGVPDGAFDAVRTDRVYIHLTDPMAALREAVRVVRPGGRVVVSEPDMASTWIATGLADVDLEFSRVVAQSVENFGAARSLYVMFRDAGLTNLHLDVRTLVVTDAAPVEKTINIKVISQAMRAEGRVATQRIDAWLEEVGQRAGDGRFLAGLTFFIVCGEKPRRHLARG